MGVVSSIISLLSVEFVGFSVGDYILSKVADIGTGKLWSGIKERFPKDHRSLEEELYCAIEDSMKDYPYKPNVDKYAAACETIYCRWIKNKCIIKQDVIDALSYLNENYIADRNVNLWYHSFYSQITKPDREQLYRWYMIHTRHTEILQIEKRQKNIAEQIDLLLKRESHLAEQNNETKISNAQNKICKMLTDPLIDEKLSLIDVYISLHGISRKNNILDRKESSASLIVDTTNYLWNWCKTEQNNIMLVHGEPGSGKSSLVKLIAGTIAGSEDDILVVFIDLYKIYFAESMPAIIAIEKYLQTHCPWFFETSINKKRLLILDGLDEIRNDVYKKAVELTEAFSLCDWNIHLNVIISGRTQIVKKALENVKAEEIEILPLYMEEQRKHYLNSEIIDRDKLLDEDLRILYWDKITRLYNIDEEMPINNERFDDLSSYPILLFLVVWTMKNTEVSFSTIKNTAELYDLIFKHIYTRQYNRDSNNIYFKQGEYEEYHQMLHYLGGCAFTNNSRAVSVNSIEEYCEKMNAHNLCDKWIQLHMYTNPSKLVLLFFLREKHDKIDVKNTQIEFIHKTFYEYLSAIAIIELLYRYTQNIDDEQHNVILLYVLSQQYINSVIIDFIYELIENETLIVDGCNITKSIFYNTIECVLKYGYNVDYPFVIANKSEDKIPASSYKKCISKVRIYEENIFKITKIFTDMMNDERLIYIDISEKDFEYANMQYWVFKKTNLSKCLFRYANLSNAQIKLCEIESADFEDVIASNTNFRNSNLTNSNFNGALLATADFSGATLDNVCFDGAMLEGAYLCDIELNHTNFAYANLIAANFDDSIIHEVNFNSADLSRADLSGIKIKSANWTNCIMANAKLDNVKILQFDLEDDDIVEMLSEADLSKADWSGVSESQRQKLKCIDTI